MKLQNALPLICMSSDKNSVYCILTHSYKNATKFWRLGGLFSSYSNKFAIADKRTDVIIQVSSENWSQISVLRVKLLQKIKNYYFIISHSTETKMTCELYASMTTVFVEIQLPTSIVLTCVGRSWWSRKYSQLVLASHGKFSLRFFFTVHVSWTNLLLPEYAPLPLIFWLLPFCSPQP